MSNLPANFLSETCEWATPQDVFDELHSEWNFTLDVCATPENAKCQRFFTRDDDGLLQSWAGEREDVPNPVPMPMKSHNTTSEVTKYVSYFKARGAKSPDAMAEAVLRTRSPRVLAAIAVTESRGDHTIRDRGYKKAHSGAWQVNARYWGRVPHTAAEQALQAERILVELTENRDIRTALNLYGGSKSGKYSEVVLAELMEVPR